MTIDASVLAGTQKSLEATLEHLPIMAWIARPDGSICFMNRAAEILFQESRESLCSRWLSLVYEGDVPRVLEAQIHSLKTGEPFCVKSRYVFSDGSFRWFEVRAKPLQNEAGEVAAWLGTSIDIHEQRAATEALRWSEARYRLFAESTREGIWHMDLQTGAIEWNDRIFTLLNVAPGEFPGTQEAFLKRVHPDDRKVVVKALEAHIHHRAPYRIQFRIKVGNEGEVYRQFVGHGLAEFDEQGTPLRIVGGLEDITEHVEADALLRERLAIIERQAEEIGALSTPIIEVWEGVVAMPLFGILDAKRAERMMEVLLDAVVTRKAAYAILDLTGAATMDRDSAEHVNRLLAAVRLLGTQGVVVGIRSEVARTWASLDVDRSRIIVLANLREALLYVMRRDRSARLVRPGS